MTEREITLPIEVEEIEPPTETVRICDGCGLIRSNGALHTYYPEEDSPIEQPLHYHIGCEERIGRVEIDAPPSIADAADYPNILFAFERSETIGLAFSSVVAIWIPTAVVWGWTKTAFVLLLVSMISFTLTLLAAKETARTPRERLRRG